MRVKRRLLSPLPGPVAPRRGCRPASPTLPPHTALLAGTLSAVLVLSSCSTTVFEDGLQSEAGSTTGEEGPYFGSSWVTREASVRTLARMLEEGDFEEVVAGTGDSGEDLIRFRVLVEDGDGYRVELDKDAWAVQPGTTGKLDSALYDAMDHNEVTWCAPVRSGQEFVEEYVARFDGAFDTAEDYYAGITDYVDCGTGESG